MSMRETLIPTFSDPHTLHRKQTSNHEPSILNPKPRTLNQEETSAKDEAYLKRLAKHAARETGQDGQGGDGDGDDEDTDDEWTDDEEEQTPIDPVDPYVVFASALQGLQAGNPARHQGLLAAAVPDAAGQQALAALVQHAEVQRAEAAAKAAAAAAGGGEGGGKS